MIKCTVKYCTTVSVLEREEGYTVKYGLSPRAIPSAQALFTVYPDLSPNTDIIPFLTRIY